MRLVFYGFWYIEESKKDEITDNSLKEGSGQRCIIVLGNVDIILTGERWSTTEKI